MTRATNSTRLYGAQQLSAESSAEIIRALDIWRQAHILTDYDVAEVVGVSRDTIGRWRRRPVALPVKTVARLVAGIEEFAESEIAARAELNRLLEVAQQSFAAAENDPAEQLQRRLREHGLRANTLAKIEAAGYTIIPKEGA